MGYYIYNRYVSNATQKGLRPGDRAYGLKSYLKLKLDPVVAMTVVPFSSLAALA